MNIKKLIFIVIIILPLLSLSQEEKKFGIKFSGFVKTDVFFDSRQTTDVREGHFLLYPANEILDVNGDDINAKSKFNILSIQTRLRGKITGPDAFGAKTSGLIEGAFFGNIGTDINGFRLRHAFVKLNWTNTELLVGQFWHPMFVTSCFPGTVSFNTGAPFQPFSRNPQIRLTQKFGDFKIIATALEQIDFVSTGPKGNSPKYLINSSVPEFNLRFEYNSKNQETGKEVLFGVGGNYKMLTPRLESSVKDTSGYKIYKSDKKATGMSGIAYFKYKSKDVTFKLEGVYGQLMYSMTMLGGYAVHDRDSVNGFQDYTPINTLSVWTDIHTNGKKCQFGLFGGYSKNLGSNEKITGPYYSRGSNIAYLYRISPRVIINSGKFRIAPEIEYTVAAYGTPDEKGVVRDYKEIGNFRFLIGVFYFF
ncbi:MAG: hypothetical protein H8D45_07875 [Bacteroidetes bacterium]|nr:hypothetical protein [Bacteroidota bacterium]MBL7104052.1 hypothetical protein [Bacteroidales bacterium]